jgi:hypothetical protein
MSVTTNVGRWLNTWELIQERRQNEKEGKLTELSLRFALLLLFGSSNVEKARARLKCQASPGPGGRGRGDSESNDRSRRIVKRGRAAGEGRRRALKSKFEARQTRCGRQLSQ